ncbi:MAG: LLM class flavin-dependent oxidoreductase [Planctomycetes bacterium]|nr:LLM class flavin-dependent oxidoreductase [Planctomycetota bacterium]
MLLQCLETWRERGHRVVAVATDADKVRRHCAEHGLRCLDAKGDFAAALQGETVDVLFAITWLAMLPASALQLPRHLAINFHDGPLPRYAGLNATCWALHAGEREHGITWHVIEAEADTGAILLQQRFPIGPDDTAFTLNARCFEAGHQSFAELADQLADNAVTPVAQDLGGRTYFGLRARPDGLAVLDFGRPAAEVARLVRAFDHGGYKNPIAIAKVQAPHGVFVPGGVELAGDASGAAPGTVTGIGADFVQVACGDAQVRLLRPRGLDNRALDAAGLVALGVRTNECLPLPDAASIASWTELGAAAAKGESAAVEVAAQTKALGPITGGARAGGGRPGDVAVDPAVLSVDLGVDPDAVASAARIVAFLARSSAQSTFSLGLRTAASAALVDRAPQFAVAFPPVAFAFDPAASFDTACSAARAAIERAAGRGPLLREVLVRRADVLPAGAVLEPPVRLCLGAEVPPLAAGSLVFAVDERGAVSLHYDAAAMRAEEASALARRLAVFARAANGNGGQRLAEVPMLDEAELRQVLRDWNDTAFAPEAARAEPAVHRQIAARVGRTPDRVALRYRGAELTFRELWQQSGRLAGWLRARGVARGDRVGICTTRGIEMVTAVVAVLRCGAAYVPLDPTYPQDRLQFMAGDAELAALIVDGRTAGGAPPAACPRIDLDADGADIAVCEPLADEADGDGATGDDLAYVIYTSGSTGRPKGVMVRHRNVANFFVGMDRVLGDGTTAPDGGTWLAVTSLSFDISVLELLWTLCRGFQTVLHAGEGEAVKKAAAAPSPTAARPITFSMFYFASDEGEHAEDKYRLLLEGARFADEHGFEAVWTPERHFHAFGGLYPNPAVASAAIAAMTKNVKIRAGSCVAPLHHPIRIAEDWALVDNLSRGRVGIAFAAGWHGRDFVLRPENFADRKGAMVDTIDKVHRLWRGETLTFAGPDGKQHEIRTLPRPVQQELPTWVTVAGNPETYRLAGEQGAYVLTHLLGQSLDELSQKLEIYRRAWRAAGHAGEGRVTLMLHTFVGDDEEQVREIVREPMKDYLRSSLDLVKQAAWSFPAFKNKVDQPGEMDALLNGGLTPADFEALLEFSFERYYRSSGLFGTPESCTKIVERLRGLTIDEIACLVDFGVPTDRVMASLPHLLDLKRRCDAITAAAKQSPSEPAAAVAAADETIPALIAAHGVTHFQCTPSMAAMLLLDPASKPALGRLSHMLVGGEALPGTLARELAAVVPNLHDVYGPTETTVWSTTWKVGGEDPVPIGRPLANQAVYVLDAHRQPVAPGSAGELWIGGAGVTAGYFRRPELTAERFVADPFSDLAGATMYRTGDLARWREDGVLEYLGRVDHQVKVRGYRIELGEIEAALSQHGAIRECAVVARGEGGETRLAAYYVTRKPVNPEELRQHLRGTLPEFMVPSFFVALADLPRTPNLKIDRKALPAPEVAAAAAAGERKIAQADNATEDAILAIWRQSLGTEQVGVEDNFFDSGGHSILAVKVHREICQRLGVELAITDLFRFTTVRALAKHLGEGKSAPTAAQQAAERAKQRRLLRRR